MAEYAATLAAEPALPPGARNLRAGLTLVTLPPRALVRLQLSRRAVGDAAAIRIRGVPLPTEPGRCAGEDPAVLWLAPDGWLIVSGSVDGAPLAAEARAACGARTAAAVDVSDALVGFELAGADARAVLARGTGLDLSADALGPGRCTRTRLAQLAVVVRSRGPDRFELVVDRGPAEWLREWLVDAAAHL